MLLLSQTQFKWENLIEHHHASAIQIIDSMADPVKIKGLLCQTQFAELLAELKWRRMLCHCCAKIVKIVLWVWHSSRMAYSSRLRGLRCSWWNMSKKTDRMWANILLSHLLKWNFAICLLNLYSMYLTDRNWPTCLLTFCVVQWVLAFVEVL